MINQMRPMARISPLHGQEAALGEGNGRGRRGRRASRARQVGEDGRRGARGGRGGGGGRTVRARYVDQLGDFTDDSDHDMVVEGPRESTPEIELIFQPVVVPLCIDLTEETWYEWLVQSWEWLGTELKKGNYIVLWRIRMLLLIISLIIVIDAIIKKIFRWGEDDEEAEWEPPKEDTAMLLGMYTAGNPFVSYSPICPIQK